MLEVLRSGRLSLGPMLGEFERAFAPRARRRPRQRGLERHRWTAPGAACGRGQRRRRGRDHAVLVRGQRQRGDLRAGAARVRRHRPGDAQPRPRRRRGGRHRPDRRAAARPCVRLPGRHLRVGAAGAADRRGRLRGARRRARRRDAGRRQRSPGRVCVLCQQAAHDGRGRDRHHVRPLDQGADRLRAKPGSRARSWTGSTTTASASTTASRTSPARLGWPSSSTSTRCSPIGRGWPRATARRWPASRAYSCRVPRPAASGAGWFVYVIQLPRGVDRDGCVRALGELGIPSKPYFPAIHLMSFYRERFGHREGEFPVCEDVAARSIALPFFPQMIRGPGASAWPRRCGRCWDGRRRRRVALLRATAPRVPRAQRLDRVRPPAGPVRRPQSRAHASMLAAQGIISEPERDVAAPRAGPGRARARRRVVPVRRRRRGHPHGDRASAHRDRRAGRRKAPHRALAQRSGGHRRCDVRPRRTPARRSR